MDEKNKGLLIVIVILSVVILLLSGIILYDKISIDYSKKTTAISESVPRASNEYFKDLLEPYKYVPENFEIVNIDDEFLQKFVIYYYSMSDAGKTIAQHTIDNTQQKSNIYTVSKREVIKLINNYFDINMALDNYTDEFSELKSVDNNYVISVSSLDYTLYNEEVISTTYDGNKVDVFFKIIDPNTNETIGNKTIKLNYEDGKFKIVSLTQNVY